VVAALAEVLLTALPAALAAAALLVASTVVGWGVMPKRLRPGHARLALPLAISTGTTVVGMAVWLVGTALSSRLAPLVVLVLVAAAACRARGLPGAVRRWAGELARLARTALPATLLLAVMALLAATNVVLPLVDSDGLRYHAALPKLFLLEGHVFVYPYDVTGTFPHAAEMLIMSGLAVAPGEVAKFLHFAFFLLSLAVLATTVHRSRATRPVAVVAALLFAAAPVALIAATYAFVDHTALFHIAVALLLATRRCSRPVAIGLALAGAVVTKYTAVPAVVAVAVAVVLRMRKGRRLAAIVATLAPAAVAFFPFAVRNVLATGDPVYPLGHGLVGRDIPGVTSAAYDWATQFHGSVPGLLGVTWFASQGPTHPDEIAGGHLLFGLVAMLVALRQPWARVLLAPVIAYVALGLGYHPPTRYLLPMLWALAGLSGAALATWWRRWAPAVGLLLVAPAAVLSSRLLLAEFRPLDLLTGALDRDAYVADQVTSVRAARVVNAQPAGGRVMALDFPAPYYFDRPWIAEGMLVEPPLKRWLAEARSVEDVLSRFRDANVTLLVVRPGWGGGTRAVLLPLATGARQQQLVIELRQRLVHVATVEGIDVYAVPPRPAR